MDVSGSGGCRLVTFLRGFRSCSDLEFSSACIVAFGTFRFTNIKCNMTKYITLNYYFYIFVGFTRSLVVFVAQVSRGDILCLMDTFLFSFPVSVSEPPKDFTLLFHCLPVFNGIFIRSGNDQRERKMRLL